MIAKRGGVGREFLDIADGTLPAVSWFDPPVIASDHAQDTTNLGPDYIAALANALATSAAMNTLRPALVKLSLKLQPTPCSRPAVLTICDRTPIHFRDEPRIARLTTAVAFTSGEKLLK